MKTQTLRDFFKQFPSDQACLDHLFEARYGSDYVCPKCEKQGKWYPLTNRRAYSCQWCGHHEYPCVDTPFHRSRTSLQLWFYAIWMFTTSRHGVAAKELERQLGVTYKAAWRMAKVIREHMSKVDGDEPLSGTVEIDESMFGGRRKGIGGGFKVVGNKAIVLGMVQRDGDVQTQVVPNSQAKTLLPIIEANVVKGSTINTDEAHAYKSLSKRGYKHEKVDHGRKEYARGDVTTNSMESYWARLKNSIRGTHVHVSSKYLDLYADEFEFRHNRRKCPETMFPELLSTFEPLKK
ncbi:MAG: IS1595 family transposase [Rhodospirillaceae bacterium]